jgi:gliding motility-associated-like protein
MDQLQHCWACTKLTLLVMVLTCLAAHGQKWQWVNNIRSPNNMGGEAMAVDPDGNVIVTGLFVGQITIGSQVLIDTDGQGDIFIIKYNPQGQVLWANQVRTPHGAYSMYLSTDESGNIYLGGPFTEQVSFGSTTLNIGSGASALFISRFNADGVFAWAVQCGSPADDNETIGGFIYHQGSVFVAGSFRGPFLFPGGGVMSGTAGSDNFFLMKLNSLTGSATFGRTIGHTCAPGSATFQLTGNCLSIDANNNLYFAGNFTHCVSLGYEPVSSISMNPPNALYNAFLAKYNLSGEILWAAPITTNAGTIFVAQVALDKDDHPYVTGSYSTDIQLSPQINFNRSNTQPYSFLARYDPTGAPLWMREITAIDPAPQIAINACGVFITGSISLPNTGVDGFPPIPPCDVYVAKYSYDNDPQWVALADGEGVTHGDVGKSIAVTESGQVYAGGFTGATMTFLGTSITVTGGLSNNLVDSFFIASIQDDSSSAINLRADADRTVLCEGQHTQLRATPGQTNYAWEKDGAALPDQTYFIEIAAPGHYTVSVMGAGCYGRSSASIDITAVAYPVLELLGADTTLCPARSIEIGARAEDDVDYMWSDGVTGARRNIDQPASYHLSASRSGCRTEGDMLVQPNTPLFVPNVITPGNDEKNECFIIKNISGQAWLRVFDRWGKRVFNASPYVNDWNGEGLGTGVYFYTLQHADGCETTYKGSIHLIR